MKKMIAFVALMIVGCGGSYVETTTYQRDMQELRGSIDSSVNAEAYCRHLGVVAVSLLSFCFVSDGEACAQGNDLADRYENECVQE